MTKLFAVLLACVALGRAPLAAQDWPTRTVKIVVPFGPGTTPDAVARLLADGLQQKVPGSTFIVENKPGASGNTGTEAVAKAEPDGATIGVSIGGPLAINTILFSKLRYNPSTDITAVTQLVTQPSVLVVNAALNVNNVGELIELLKKAPDKYIYGSIGVGSLSHLAMEALAQKAGVKLVHLPLQGSPAAMTALLRNDVQIACLPAIAVTPQMQSGQLKVLAVSTAKRSPFLADIPTLKEAGVDVEADAWMGLIAPAGLPPAVLEKLHKLTIDVLASSAMREKLAAQQMEPIGNSPVQFRALIDSEIGRWEPVIKSANVKIN